MIDSLRLKMNPAGKMLLNTPDGGPQPHPYDFQSHLAVYMVDVWAFAAMRAIAEAVSAVPLLVQRRQTVDGEQQWVTIQDNDLAKLIAKPNNDEPFSYLLNRWMLSLLGSGNGYLAYDKQDRELFYLKPDWVTVTADSMGRIVGYEIRHKGVEVNQDIEQIIHIKLANPDGEYYGLPPSKVVEDAILTKLYLNGYIKSYFKNDALPGTTFSTDRALDATQREVLRKEFNKLHGGYDNAFKVAILDSGAKLDRLAHNLKDLIPTEIYRMIREEVLAAYGTPHVVVGVLDDASYANADIQKKLFYENRIDPLLSLVESFLNLQFTPQFGDNLRLWFDRSKMVALQEDENAKAERTVKLYRGGIITLNESREKLNYEAVNDGDEFYSLGGNFDFGGDVGSGGDATKRSMTSDHKGSDPRLEYWTAFEKRLTKKEGRYSKRIVGYWDGQLDRILKVLKDKTNDGRMMSRLSVMMSKGPIDDDNIDEFFNIAEENKILKSEIGPFIEMLVSEAGREAIELAHLNLDFNVSNPEVHTMIEAFKNRITGINKKSYDTVKGILKDAVDSGEGVGEIERHLRDTFKDWTKVRSRTVARTEMTGIVNGGSIMAHKQGGVTHKEWISTMDPNTRDLHVAANGEIVPIDERFKITGVYYPGDPDGLPEDVINCRCTYAPIIR